MTRLPGDMLDALARRLAPASPSVHRESESSAPLSSSDDHLSRAAAVRYAMAGIASLSLGLWRVPEGRALTRDECEQACFARRGNELEDALKACRRLYSPSWYNKPGTDTRWGAFKETVSGGPWGWLKNFVNNALLDGCLTRAQKRFEESLDKCMESCEVACEGSRSLQGPSLFRRACEPPPSPPPHTPSPPPAPSATADPCLACNQVGGMCCGPFKATATGDFQPCACANPALGCERYGCG